MKSVVYVSGGLIVYPIGLTASVGDALIFFLYIFLCLSIIQVFLWLCP